MLNRPHPYDNRTLLQEVCNWTHFKDFVVECLFLRHQVQCSSSGNLISTVCKDGSKVDVKIQNGYNVLYFAIKAWLQCSRNENQKQYTGKKCITIMNCLQKRGEPLMNYIMEHDEKGRSVYTILRDPKYQADFDSFIGKDVLSFIYQNCPQMKQLESIPLPKIEPINPYETHDDSQEESKEEIVSEVEEESLDEMLDETLDNLWKNEEQNNFDEEISKREYYENEE